MATLPCRVLTESIHGAPGGDKPTTDFLPPKALPSTDACVALRSAPVDAIVARLGRELPRPLVFANGMFDLLHAGHVDCLEAARRMGAALVVGVHSDASARRLLKGRGQPINSQADRARVVGALAAVTAVVVFDEVKPLALICALRPEIYVRGGDCDPRLLVEAELVAEWGGRTEIVPRRSALSSSGLIDRVRHGPWRPAMPGAAR